MIDSLHDDAKRLVRFLADRQRLWIAFSGGVDSSVVLAAAARAGLKELVAVTADSPSVPRWQIGLAQQIAGQLGTEHLLLPTGETESTDYKRNDNRRCFFCKQVLYQTILQAANQRRSQRDDLPLDAPCFLVSGTNLDDLGDYRPGLDAGNNYGVLTPLADLGLNKQRVRRLARYFDLPNHDLPAAPCLASRIAYGTEVTVERLRRIEEAEGLLHELGFREVRVRLHADELARIEVDNRDLDRVWKLIRQTDLAKQFRKLGFRFVTVDPEGLESGSMNRVLVSIELPRAEPSKEVIP